jgi:hypothetical protein
VKTINVYYNNHNDLKQVISNYKNLFTNSNAVLVQVFSGTCDTGFLTTLSKQITELVPHAYILGATTCGEIMNGMVSGRKTVLSFSVFQHSDIKTSYVFKNDMDDYAVGRAIATALSTDKTKVLILFATGLTVNSVQMLKGVHSIAPRLPVAGGNAADNFSHNRTFVFCNEGTTDCGVVGAALTGEQLTVSQHWQLGWQPIGKKMTITRADERRVYTIDNIPAFQVYQKYLGLGESVDIHDVIEFPLLMNRSGVQMTRIPHIRYDDDSIGFSADLVEGEEIGFSFGEAKPSWKWQSIHSKI